MYRRFWIICSVIGAALLALSALGLSSLGMHERSLRAERQNQFAAVAEQIRYDVKIRLDEFLQAEQRRPYTDYQYVYLPETANETEALVRSPLADSMTHGLAFGHFQIDAAGHIATPYARADLPKERLEPALAAYLETLKTKVLTSLNGYGRQPLRRPGLMEAEAASAVGRMAMPDVAAPTPARRDEPAALHYRLPQAAIPQETPTRAAGSRAQTYPIESLQEAQATQTVVGQRGMVARNIAMGREEPETPMQGDLRARAAADSTPLPASVRGAGGMPSIMGEPPAAESRKSETEALSDGVRMDMDAAPTVQIRIEPFVPLIVPEEAGTPSVFPGQIFLVRHVQIEGVHLLQGFRLNAVELAELVQESARRLLREGMSAELNQHERPDAAHTAILDFGFGELVLNLLELNPGWIAARVARLNVWMAAILTIVWLAVVLAMAALWRNLHAQVKLARQKDDFISAVSHELRTPLTSIRMYTEMLEKDWIKDDAKRREYYGTMRQESERLSRLIENVLDFSRLQRGKKQFDFRMGNLSDAVSDVIEMMRPCAERAGFVITPELTPIEPFAFDRDAVMQIAINLIDNALKYAKEARDRRIIVRTLPENGCALLEVEDHGPGVPMSQQKRIFEAFYRSGNEATRQSTGTGLGLALVRRFAQAHHGGVEIISAKPGGALFRVRLAR